MVALDENTSRTRRKAGATAFARQLRKGENVPEAILWNHLKSRKLGGHKFVRQFPIGPYFADFLCRSQKVVVEVDGSQHVESEHDLRRDQFMHQAGYSIVRFWSGDVAKNPEAVCETILAILNGDITEKVVSMDLKFIPAQPPPLRLLREYAQNPPLPQTKTFEGED